MTISELQKNYLSSSSEIRIAPEDFFILLAHATNKEKIFLLTHPEYSLNKSEEAAIRNFLARRIQHEPVALIIGHKEFYGRDFIVTKDTLIPRPETEQIIELALNEINNQGKITLIDIGTGSGNIVISLVKEIEKKYQSTENQYHAIDISTQALKIAQENAKRHNANNVITFHEGNLLSPITEVVIAAKNIIITANLPYLSVSLYNNAPEDVRKFEPKSALLSEQEGLDHYYRLLKSIKDIHTDKQSITLFLEISPEQAGPLQTYILSFFPNAQIHIHKDLAGKDRVVAIHIR